jgi:hypothetical protein
VNWLRFLFGMRPRRPAPTVPAAAAFPTEPAP